MTCPRCDVARKLLGMIEEATDTCEAPPGSHWADGFNKGRRRGLVDAAQLLGLDDAAVAEVYNIDSARQRKRAKNG